MSIRSVPCLLALLCVGAVCFAGDDVPRPTPVPAAHGDRPVRPQRPTVIRPFAAFSVDVAVVDPDDPETMAQLTEMGAQGFHIVASGPMEGGKFILFMERSFNQVNVEVVLPTVIEKDPVRAKALREKLKAVIAERTRVMVPPLPTPEPTATGAAAHPAVPSLPAVRSFAAFGVDVCVIDPKDLATVEKWADMGAHGYHTISMSPKDGGKFVLFLERWYNQSNPEVYLPSVIEKDPVRAKALDAKLHAVITERGTPPPPADATAAAPMSATAPAAAGSATAPAAAP